jgi:hypothetical protein
MYFCGLKYQKNQSWVKKTHQRQKNLSKSGLRNWQTVISPFIWIFTGRAEDPATVTRLTVIGSAYSFSGGQIENIVRKYTVDCILNGTEPSVQTVHGYCKTEFLYKNDVKKKIGFK